MKKSLKALIRSSQIQLNIIGISIVFLLGFCAWHISLNLTWGSLLPLIFVVYGFLRIIYELTLNRSNIPTLATSLVGRKKVTNLLISQQAKSGTKNFKIVDLGSGRGELANRFGREIPGASVLGIEIARIPYWQSIVIQKLFGPKNVSFSHADFWNFDCSDIDAVYFFLNPTFAKRAGEKLFLELKTGAMVISHSFPLQGAWIPTEIIEHRTPFKESIYIYKKT